MVRVYSQPGQGGDSSLGGLFGNSNKSRQGLDYDDLLNQKRRDEHKYRSGSDPYEPVLKSSSSEGFLKRVAPPPEYPDTGLQNQLDHLSTALSRLQGSVEPNATGDYPTDYGYSKSYPNSANGNLESPGRKTWSAPNKDPFGAEELQNEMDKNFKNHAEELGDPLQRKSSHSRQSNGGGYQPSFANGGINARVRRGGGNAAPPGVDRERYLQDLEQQMHEQKRRKEREEADEGTDWWEKKKQTSNESKVPHPSQDHSYIDRHATKQEIKPSHQRPDPAEARKRYEQELKEQMDSKKRVDEDRKQKEREEEDKLERRLKEQQDKMKREFDEEMNRKKSKEEAKLKRQEELMRRQVELQKEMDQKKREADEKRQSERRGSHRPRSRKPSAEATEPPPGLNFRSDSPPIPTMRSNQKGGPDNHGGESTKESANVSNQNPEAESPGVADQLQTMRHSLERRQESLKGEDDLGAGGWDGLAEL